MGSHRGEGISNGGLHSRKGSRGGRVAVMAAGGTLVQGARVGRSHRALA